MCGDGCHVEGWRLVSKTKDKEGKKDVISCLLSYSNLYQAEIDFLFSSSVQTQHRFILLLYSMTSSRLSVIRNLDYRLLGVWCSTTLLEVKKKRKFHNLEDEEHTLTDSHASKCLYITKRNGLPEPTVFGQHLPLLLEGRSHCVWCRWNR